MKKITLLVLAVCSLLASCKKNTDATYYVKFSVNGNSKEYTGHVFAHTDFAGGFTTLTILGSTSSISYDNFFGMYIGNFPSGNPIGPGEYKDTSGNFTVLATYVNNGTEEYEAGSSMAEDAVSYGVVIPNHFKMNITEQNSETTRGTFSGDFFQDGNVQTGTRISITNGEFYAKYQ